MPQGEIKLTWGDGENVFNVAKLGTIRELQEKTGFGPLRIFRNFQDGTWKVDEARETLRLGLIGGGMEPGLAHALVSSYFDGRPWMESLPVAQAVLMAALLGVPEDKPEAAKGSKKKTVRNSKTPKAD